MYSKVSKHDFFSWPRSSHLKCVVALRPPKREKPHPSSLAVCVERPSTRRTYSSFGRFIVLFFPFPGPCFLFIMTQCLHRFDQFYLFNRLGDDETQVSSLLLPTTFQRYKYNVPMQASRGTEMMRDCKQAKLRWMDVLSPSTRTNRVRTYVLRWFGKPCHDRIVAVKAKNLPTI